MKSERRTERPGKRRLPKRGNDWAVDDAKVDEASQESFPASDPSAHTSTVASRIRPEAAKRRRDGQP